jgi:hypothetical protein
MMLNDDDIRKRLEMYPEPPEVAEIRRNIKESFKRLEFQEGPHKYFIHEDDGTVEELCSVSGTIEKFEPYTDWDTITANYALKNGYTVEEVTRMWHETNILATNAGTGAHLYGEMYMHFIQGHPEEICDIIKPQYEDGYLLPHSPKESAAMKYYQDIHDIFMDDNKPVKLWPVMPEAQIYIFKDNPWGLKHRYAGTFDILHAFQGKDGKWKLALHDFKTNAKIVNDFIRSKKQMMEPPFEEYFDEALSHYTVQLSLYSLGLRQLGYEIADRKLIWLKDDGTYEKIPIPDITEKCIEALK